jgi:ABC-2 type transport system permease protein
MKSTLSAEFKKLLTVRYTYAISIFFLLLLGFISFYGQGYKAEPGTINNLFLAGTIVAIANVASVAGGLIGLLLMAHEYRYNTIVYTLASSNSRSKVLAAKIISVFGFVLVYSILATALGLALTALGAKVAGHSIPHQDINYLVFFAKSVFTCEAFALVGLLIPALVRNMQASVAVLFIVPNTLEALLSIVIKHPDKWLPFHALAQVTEPPIMPDKLGHIAFNEVSPVRGAVTFLIYLAIGWLIGWYLFLRRDAA